MPDSALQAVALLSILVTGGGGVAALLRYERTFVKDQDKEIITLRLEQASLDAHLSEQRVQHAAEIAALSITHIAACNRIREQHVADLDVLRKSLADARQQITLLLEERPPT